MSQPEVKRYDFVQTNRFYQTDHHMEEADEGEWVKFDDVDALLSSPGQQEKNEDGAGLIHQIASPLAETEPRPTCSTCDRHQLSASHVCCDHPKILKGSGCMPIWHEMHLRAAEFGCIFHSEKDVR